MIFRYGKPREAPKSYIGVGEGPHGIFRPWARWMGRIDRDAVASVVVCRLSVPPGPTHPRPTRDVVDVDIDVDADVDDVDDDVDDVDVES